MALDEFYYSLISGFASQTDGRRECSKCISLRQTGRPTSRCNQTPAREERAREKERHKRNWKHAKGRFHHSDPRRDLPVSILPFGHFTVTQAPGLFSRLSVDFWIRVVDT